MTEASLYDEVPYPGRAFPQTHPDRLATMATLYGLDPVAPAACSVVELGCGDGGNLLPMALTLPGSTFLGIDSSAYAIERARSIAAELGLDNVRFEELGFDDFEPPRGSADYVIAHGVYSWVPADVRDRLLVVAAQALSERGVAYVSYNVLPGHRTRQTLRDMLALELEGIDEPGARMAAARELLAQVAAIWPSGPGLETTLGSQARMLVAQDDALFFHDTLAPINLAPYFRDFAKHAAENGLQFLAEAEITEMQSGALPPELQERLLAADDVVRREQLMDFLKQRMFRQTLLCHAGLQVDPEPRLARAAKLAAAGPIEHETDASTGRVTFTGSAGATLTTDHPLLVSALQRIGERWPAAAWLRELGSEQPAPPHELAVLCEALVRCFQANLVRLHVHPPIAETTPGERPRASPLARLQARDRENMTTLRHTSVRLEDELGWQLVVLLDGTRDRAALLGELEARLEGGPYPALAADIDRSLDTLASVALLMPVG
jgi:SAM-dependent methyltransferase